MTPAAREAMIRRLHRQFAEMQKKQPPRCANTGAVKTSHNACAGERQGIRG